MPDPPSQFFEPSIVLSEFSIWPFDQPNAPLVVEIFPRLLTGAVIKSDPQARIAYLKRHAELPASTILTAASSPDAFDAVVSVIRMDEHLPSFSDLTYEAEYALEGKMWRP